MQASLLREWKDRFNTKIRANKGVSYIGIGQVGLKIALEYDNATVQERIMEVFEQEAPDVPYRTEVVGKVAKV